MRSRTFQRHKQTNPNMFQPMTRVYLRQDGVDIRLNTSLLSVRREGNQRIATLQQAANTSEMRCDEILVAVGRAPNIEGLDLEAGRACHS